MVDRFLDLFSRQRTWLGRESDDGQRTTDSETAFQLCARSTQLIAAHFDFQCLTVSLFYSFHTVATVVSKVKGTYHEQGYSGINENTRLNRCISAQ